MHGAVLCRTYTPVGEDAPIPVRVCLKIWLAVAEYFCTSPQKKAWADADGRARGAVLCMSSAAVGEDVPVAVRVYMKIRVVAAEYACRNPQKKG